MTPMLEIMMKSFTHGKYISLISLNVVELTEELLNDLILRSSKLK